ncbi:glycosyltransferase family 4 protein [Archangium sp.]|uniref:glycosyltransferase family 4 protein n=1 Tax=Archangium sp. TaxID=1872627 RepID=UPI003899F800
MSAPLLETPHVVVVTTEYTHLRVGGLGTYTEMLMDYLRRKFAHIHVVEMPYSNRDPIAVSQGPFGEQVIRAPFPNFQLKLDTQYDPKLEELYRLLPMDQPLLILGNESYGAYVGTKLRAAAKNKASLIYVPHLFASLANFNGYAGERFGELLRTAPPWAVPHMMKDVEMLSQADHVLFISQYMHAYASKHLGGEPPRNTVIGHYVEAPATVKERYSDEVRNVIFMGRLELQKGLHEVFEHLEDVLQCLPKATLHIYGKGSLKHVLRWRGRRLDDRLVWHGFKPREEVLKVLPEMDLAIMPSIYEPFGYSALEAMAAGVPLITSDVGGLGELTDWMPEGLRLRTSEGNNPLFGDGIGVGTCIPREEILRVFSHAAAHPGLLAETARRGVALTRELYNVERYTRQMDTFIDACTRSLMSASDTAKAGLA